MPWSSLTTWPLASFTSSKNAWTSLDLICFVSRSDISLIPSKSLRNPSSLISSLWGADFVDVSYPQIRIIQIRTVYSLLLLFGWLDYFVDIAFSIAINIGWLLPFRMPSNIGYRWGDCQCFWDDALGNFRYLDVECTAFFSGSSMSCTRRTKDW